MSGPFVHLVIFFKASLEILEPGYIILKKPRVANPKLLQTSIKIATLRTSGIRLTARGLWNVIEMVTTWVENTKEAATNCTALSCCSVARWWRVRVLKASLHVPWLTELPWESQLFVHFFRKRIHVYMLDGVTRPSGGPCLRHPSRQAIFSLWKQFKPGFPASRGEETGQKWWRQITILRNYLVVITYQWTLTASGDYAQLEEGKNGR